MDRVRSAWHARHPTRPGRFQEADGQTGSDTAPGLPKCPAARKKFAGNGPFGPSHAYKQVGSVNYSPACEWR